MALEKDNKEYNKVTNKNHTYLYRNTMDFIYLEHKQNVKVHRSLRFCSWFLNSIDWLKKQVTSLINNTYVAIEAFLCTVTYCSCPRQFEIHYHCFLPSGLWKKTSANLIRNLPFQNHYQESLQFFPSFSQ